MGMSTHVIGIAPADDKWKAMKAIWDNCEALDIQPPDEVGEFFGWEVPDPSGVTVELDEKDGVTTFTDERSSSQGFMVELSKLPSHVKFLKFVNSW